LANSGSLLGPKTINAIAESIISNSGSPMLNILSPPKFYIIIFPPISMGHPQRKALLVVSLNCLYNRKMMEFEFLKTLVIIFGVSATVVFILHKFRIPSIVGFLVAGVFLGPHGFGFVQDISEVELSPK
jgi:hypothetical protein